MQSTSSGSGLFSFLSGIFAHIFGQIVSVIRKRLRNTNLVASIYFKMKKTSLLVDEWPSKTPLLNLPIVDVLSCNQRMKGKKYFWYFTHRFTRVMKDKLPKLHVILHCCSALKVFPLKHNSYVRTQGNFTDTEILTGARLHSRQWKPSWLNFAFLVRSDRTPDHANTTGMFFSASTSTWLGV